MWRDKSDIQNLVVNCVVHRFNVWMDMLMSQVLTIEGGSPSSVGGLVLSLSENIIHIFYH